MGFAEVVQTMSALGALVMIMLGSAWLKRILKQKS